MPRTPSSPALAASSIFEVVKTQNHGAIRERVRRWAESYKRHSPRALAELLSFIAEACGCDVEVTVGEVMQDDPDATVKRVQTEALNGQVTAEDPFTTRRKEYKNFRPNYLEFWDQLVSEAQDNETLVNDDPFEELINYITCFAQSTIRTCRFTATVTALQLVSTFVRVATRLREARETTQRQMAAEESKAKSPAQRQNPRLASLTKSLEALHVRVSSLEALMKQVFNGVFVQRYRDIDDHIRVECITAMGKWCSSYSVYFLKDTYLKYIGWSLNDKEPLVRIAALAALQVLYDFEQNFAPMDTFTARFYERVLQMVDDVDPVVAVKALGVLTRLVSAELLEPEMIKGCYTLLLDDAPAVRHAAAELVNTFLAMQSKAKAMLHSSDLAEESMSHLLLLLSEFGDNPKYIPYLVDSLWDKSSALKDWKCMIALLLSDEELPDKFALNLVRVLKSSVMKASGGSLVPEDPASLSAPKPAAPKKELSKQQKEQVAAFKQELTLHLMRSLPQLLRKYQSDPTKASELVSLVQYAHIELYSLKRQDKLLVALLKQIKECFVRFAEPALLRASAAALVFCASESSHESAQVEAQKVLQEMVKETVQRLRKVAAHSARAAAAKQALSEEEAFDLAAALERAFQLQHAGLELPEANLHEAIAPLVDAALEGWDCQPEILVAAVKTVFEELLWSLKRASSSPSPDLHQLQDVVKRRDALVASLQRLYDATQHTTLRSAVYNVLADILFIFSAEKVKGTNLEMVGFQAPLAAMQTFWKHCEAELATLGGDDSTSDKGVNALLVLSHAARLVAYNLVPEHGWLAPAIVSHFTQHGNHVAELIKHMLTRIKKISPESLWEVYLNSLKMAYERQAHSGGSEAALAHFKELSSKIANVYSGNLVSDRPNAAKIVRGGIEYAFADPERRMGFLSHGLAHFTSKITDSDISALVRYFEANDPVDTTQSAGTWAPFYQYVNHLRKSINMPPMSTPSQRSALVEAGESGGHGRMSQSAEPLAEGVRVTRNRASQHQQEQALADQTLANQTTAAEHQRVMQIQQRLQLQQQLLQQQQQQQQLHQQQQEHQAMALRQQQAQAQAQADAHAHAQAQAHAQFQAQQQQQMYANVGRAGFQDQGHSNAQAQMLSMLPPGMVAAVQAGVLNMDTVMEMVSQNMHQKHTHNLSEAPAAMDEGNMHQQMQSGGDANTSFGRAKRRR